MARAGMALRRGTNHTSSEGGDDVQSSIELLDRVLSEFDDIENANPVQNIQQLTSTTQSNQSQQNNTTSAPTNNVSSTPEDESPSLGHQSEDDGYMSMNGRKQKFSLAFKPLTEVPVHQENPQQQQQHMPPGDPNDFPPPPEEAERLISTLLPKVSPAHSAKRNTGRRIREFPRTQPQGRSEYLAQRLRDSAIIYNGLPNPKNSATQTTLPKTRHQRPYGWEKTDFTLQPPPPPPGYRYGSLPFSHAVYPITSPTRVPPRTVPTASERHREVRRRGSEDNLSSDLEETALRPLSELADDEHFSDDSLEEMLPPPPPVATKRSSIAWEVPLDVEEALLTPGSTKVVGRRRRKSGSHSSTSSIPNVLRDAEDWPEPPPCSTEDEVASPFSDSDDPVVLPEELNGADLNGSGTYIIRRGKKDRKPVAPPQHMSGSQNSNSSLNSRLSSDLSIPHSRFSVDLNSRLSRELNTPNSRYSIDLSTPHSRISQELNSPKSRYSLDLNNSRHELMNSPSRFSMEMSSSRSRSSSSRSSTPSKYGPDFKKHSITFDNMKSLMKEGVIESYNEPPSETVTDFSPTVSPIIRVVSLPTLSAEEYTPRRELAVTVEEEEDVDSPRQTSAEISPLRKIEQNISQLLERRDIEVSSVVQDEKCILQINGNGIDRNLANIKCAPSKPTRASVEKARFNDLQKSSSHNEIQRSEDYYRQLLVENGNKSKRNGIQKSESAKEMLLVHQQQDKERPLPSSTSADFPVRVEVLQHEFPPLPPSPVEEDEDEYSEILHPLHQKTRADTLPITSEPPAVPPHRDPITNSLKTRSMDAGFSRGRRNNPSFLNTELPGTRRRTYQKRSSHSPREELHMQTSCSLPETPIFARGCDIPRTPHRRAPDVPGRGGPRQSNTMGTLNSIGNTSTGGYGRCGRSNSGLEQAIVGAELLRLAGGPGRGWYPRHRHPRPASIEHLDRLAPGHNPWDSTRKPLTLPPNLTPKFFQRSPREALRRVTSLLIRKGNTGKETKKEKEVLSPSVQEKANGGEEAHKKKGFFKNLWKRSRHYSLEQQ